MAKSNAKYLALANVYGCKVQDIDNDPSLQHVLTSALFEVSNYAGLLPDETDELKKRRGELQYTGNPNMLSNHIKSFTDYKGFGAWEVIFSTYKKLDTSTVEQSVTETKVDEVQPAEVSQHVTDVILNSVTSPTGVHNNDKSIKEDIGMSEEIKNAQEQNNETLESLEQSIRSGDAVGADVVKTDGSLPVSSDLEQAINTAKNKVNEDRDRRLQFTKSASVVEALIRRPPMGDVLEKGAETQGVLESRADVQNQYGSFCKKVGLKEEKGEISFTNVPAASLKQAKALYDQFQLALQDPTTPWEVFISKSKGSWSVIGLQTNGNAEIQYLTRDEATSLLLTESIGAVSCSQGGQLRLVEATRTNNNRSKKTNQRNTASKSKSAYSGVVSPRFTDRNVTQSANFIYVIDGEIENKKGPKSMLSCQYFTGSSHEDKYGNTVEDVRTFRVTLSCPQKKLSIKRPELNKFASAAAVGANVPALDFENADAVNSAVAGIASVLGKISVSGRKTNNKTIKDIREGIEKANADKINEQASDLSDVANL